MQRTYPCPKCGRTLRANGELTVDLGANAGGPASVPTFQCDECMMIIDFSGEQMEVALTFAVDADGNAFDPADPDGKLRF